MARVHDIWMQSNFHSWSAWEQTGRKGCTVAAAATQLGTTREVVLDVDGPTSPVKDPAGNLHMGASATTKLNRRDFGVSGAGSLVADDIAITLDVELIQRVSAPATPPASR